MSELTLRYAPEAEAEYQEQVEYYERQAAGLGRLFSEAIQKAESLLRSNPEGLAFVRGSSEIRVVVVRRFPFRLLYAMRGGEVLIVAVAHTAREPGQFTRRA